ncbi:ABC transporter substrate-binding protein [Chitinibacteraceae bacterium HSL-7]
MLRRLLLALVLLCLVGCSGQQPPLRIGLNAWPGYEYLFLAQELGYYRDEGVDVKLISFSSLADSLRAFERGQLDLIGSTLVEPLMARDGGEIEPVLIYAADYSNGGDMLLAQDYITDVAALRGRKLALEGRTVDVMTATLALQSAGLALNDVELVDLPQANAVKAFTEGKVDAIQTYPPFASELLQGGHARLLFDTTKAPGMVVDVLVATRSGIKTRKAELVRVLRAFERARAYHATHPADAARIMGRHQKVSPDELTASFTGLHIIPMSEQRLYFAQGKLAERLAATHATLKQLGAVSGSPCGTECIDGSVATAASAR